MSVAVLLRAIEDPELAAGVTGSCFALDEASTDAVVLALVAARALGEPIVGIASGPEGWEPALRDAIALGIGEVVRTWSEEMADADALGRAAAIAGVVPSDARIVVAGGAPSDNGSGLLPFALAEILGWPAIEDVIEIRSNGDEQVVRARASGGRRLDYRLGGTAVLVAARGGAAPYPTVARRLAARRAALGLVSPSGLVDEGRLRFEGFGPARPVTRHLLQPQASASAGGRLRSLMSGGAAPKVSSEAIEATAGFGAQLVALLAREGLV